MSQLFEAYLKKVIQQVDGTFDEKMDVKEELLTHLHMSKQSFMEEGFKEEQAELFALENFGNATSIGKDMQQAMYPYRRSLLFILGFMSLFTIFCIYIVVLVVDRDALIGWLLFSVASSILLLLLAGQFFQKLEQNSILIGLFIVHTLLFIYGYGIVSQIDSPISMPLSFLVFANILCPILFIYRIVLYDYPFPPLNLKIIHLINITFGVIYSGASLFFIWVMLSFIHGAGYYSIIPLSLLIFWAVSYFIQIKLMNHQKEKTAYCVLGFTHIIAISLISFLLI